MSISMKTLVAARDAMRSVWHTAQFDGHASRHEFHAAYIDLSAEVAMLLAAQKVEVTQ